MLDMIDILAKKHPQIKFVKSVATKSVENFADAHCPAMFFYKNEELVHTDVPCTELLGGKKMNYSTLEWVMAERGLIEVEYDEDPRDKLKLMNMIVKHGKDLVKRGDDIDDDGDDREYMDNQFQRYR